MSVKLQESGAVQTLTVTQLVSSRSSLEKKVITTEYGRELKNG